MTELDTTSGAGADAPGPETTTELPEQGGQTRDERGRFAGQGDEGQGGQRTVPHEALHASREREKAARSELDTLKGQFSTLQAQLQGFMAGQRPQAQPQPQAPTPPPDPFVDPEGFNRHIAGEAVKPVAQAQQSQFAAVSEAIANSQFGEDVVKAADQAVVEYIQQNPHMVDNLKARMMRPGVLPHVEAVKWHREQQALSRYGTDPEAYINAEIERRMAEAGQQPQQFQPPAAGAQPPRAPMPSSFAGAASRGPRGPTAGTGPRSLSEIMNR